MRICFITGEYPPMQGGVGDYTRELSRALIQLGQQIAVVTSSKATPQNAAQQEQEPIVRPMISRWNWASGSRILQAVHDFQADVLHIQYQTAAYAMHPMINFLPLRLHRSRKRPRIVVTFHDLRIPYLFPKAGAVRSWVNLVLARWSDAVIATNPEDYEQLNRLQLPVAPWLIPIGSNIHPQLPPGYDRSEWRKRLGVAENEVLLCYFGFLNESKGGETLLRSVAELLRRGRSVRLLMIGGQVGDSDPTNRAYFEHILDMSRRLGLADAVMWTGYTAPEEVSANLMSADMCLLPYRDGASFRRGSFMAALAHGMPIITTEPRGPATRLSGEENVLLVPPDDPASMATAAERLIEAPALRARLSHGAIDLAEGFTWERIAAQTTRQYGRLGGDEKNA